MTQDRQERIFEIFATVCDLSAAESLRVLDELCAGDDALRAGVEALLQRDSGDYRDSITELVDSGVRRATEQLAENHLNVPGEIGHYKILDEIGQGGMSVVYEARQSTPVKRRVALKVIRPGMDTRQVIARFDSERQALALMDHPNIAKIFDGGTTANGRPFFVMELVKGAPIDAYCDSRRLTLRERLELMCEVCEAVHHAHQKAIIHRDLKPSNILVSDYAGRPHPKIIDFGISKATTRDLSGDDFYTRQGTMLGTPGYMSPEQLASGGEDVDTRADVFGLGIVLYKLLTGQLPVDRATLGDDPSVVRERLLSRDVPRPSTRVTASDCDADTVARDRRTTLSRLRTDLGGDLDWIVMKAVEHDRSRRYASTHEMAADMRRFLACEPVVARPPSVGYRVGKFVRRNRITVVAASLVIVALILGVVGTSLGLLKARRAETVAARESATAMAVADFLARTLSEENPELRGGDGQTMVARLDSSVEELERLADQPEVRARLSEVMSDAYRALDRPERAVALAESAIDLRSGFAGDDDPSLVTALTLLSRAQLEGGDAEAGRQSATRAVALCHGGEGVSRMTHARALLALALAEYTNGDFEAEERLGQQVLDVLEGVEGEDASMVRADTHNLIGRGATDTGDFVLAADSFRAALADLDERPAGRHLAMLIQRDFGNMLIGIGALAQGEERLAASVELGRQVYGENNAAILGNLVLLGRAQYRRGRVDEAQTTLEDAKALAERTIGPEHLNYGRTLIDYGRAKQAAGDFGAARESYVRAYDIVASAVGPEHATSVNILYSQAFLPFRQQRFAESASRIEAALDVITRAYGDRHHFTYGARGYLAAARARVNPAALDALSAHVDAGAAIRGGMFSQRAWHALYLAQLRRLQGAYDDAEAALALTIEIREHNTGAEEQVLFIDPRLTRAEISADRNSQHAGALRAEAMDMVMQFGDLAGIRQWGYRTRLARLEARSTASADLVDRCFADLASLRDIVGNDHTLSAVSAVDCAEVALRAGDAAAALHLLDGQRAALDDVIAEAFGSGSWRVAELRALRALASDRRAAVEQSVQRVAAILGSESPVVDSLRQMARR